MRDGVVLHTQKVAGISGSEAHLLQLLPDLRARGWDVRFLMLHEDEPGAWEFARELQARGVPLDDIRLRADVDPIAFGEIAAYLARVRPTVLHTHLVHADVYGQLAGSLSRVPLRLSTKHGFNEFREGRWFGVADRSVSSLAHVHVAISRGLAQYLAETEGFREEDFEIVHYGVASSDGVEPVRGKRAEARVRRAAHPDQGPRRPASRARTGTAGGAQGSSSTSPDAARSRRRSRATRVSSGSRRRCASSASSRRSRLRSRTPPSSSCPRWARASGWSRSRRWSGRRPVIASAVGGLPEIVADGETGLVVPPADVGALADAIVALAGDLPRAAEMGAVGRVRALAEFTPERCVERIEALYLRALEAAPT